jgi:hypothetical protein
MLSDTFLTAAFLPKKTDKLRTVRAGAFGDLTAGAAFSVGLADSGMAFKF